MINIKLYMDVIICAIKRRPLLLACMIVVLCSAISYKAAGSGVHIEDGAIEGFLGYVQSMSYDEISYGTGQKTEYLSVSINRVCTEDGKAIALPLDRIRVQLPTDSRIHIGQYINVRGKVHFFEDATNPGQFDAHKFYMGRGVLFDVYDGRLEAASGSYSHIRDGLLHIRLSGEAILGRYLDKEDASIIKAMLFGNKSELNEEIRTLFRENGIAHILAISGLHISFLAMLFYRLLGWLSLPLKIRVAVSEAAIILYGMMVGFTASSFRAICMFSFFLLAKGLLRTYDMLNAVALSLAFTALICPAMLFDTGLQLSYTAVIGVGYFYLRFKNNIHAPGRYFGAFYVSLFVFLSTLPVMLLSYYEVAFYSILLNLFIIPLMSVLLTASILLVLCGNFFRPGLSILLIKSILWMYKSLCRFLSDLDIGGFNIGAPKTWQIIAFYLILMIAVNYKGMHRTAVSCGMLLSSVILIYIRPSFGLDICMMDVGQGDCMVLMASDSILLESHTYIIDCGSSSKKSVGEKRLIPMLKYYGTDVIEGVFITHPDEDHISGIEELLCEAGKEHIKIKNVYVYEGFLGTDELKKIEDMTQVSVGPVTSGPNEIIVTDSVNRELKKDVPVLHGIDRGEVITDGDLVFNVLNPKRGTDVMDANEASLVMDVSYRDFHMLTTGDAGEGAERDILRAFGDKDVHFDVLKTGHHGSSSSSCEEFLSWVRPRVALISCGRNNQYGHPHKETLMRLEGAGADIMRTDRSGALRIKTDGKHIRAILFLPNAE